MCPFRLFFFVSLSLSLSLSFFGCGLTFGCSHVYVWSMEAFSNALAQGATLLELDVYLTSDNQVVVVHDHKLGRLCDGTSSVICFSFCFFMSLLCSLLQ